MVFSGVPAKRSRTRATRRRRSRSWRPQSARPRRRPREELDPAAVGAEPRPDAPPSARTRRRPRPSSRLGRAKRSAVVAEADEARRDAARPRERRGVSATRAASGVALKLRGKTRPLVPTKVSSPSAAPRPQRLGRECLDRRPQPLRRLAVSRHETRKRLGVREIESAAPREQEFSRRRRRASWTTTRWPPVAIISAAIRPAGPAPTTIALVAHEVDDPISPMGFRRGANVDLERERRHRDGDDAVARRRDAPDVSRSDAVVILSQSPDSDGIRAQASKRRGGPFRRISSDAAVGSGVDGKFRRKRLESGAGAGRMPEKTPRVRGGKPSTRPQGREKRSLKWIWASPAARRSSAHRARGSAGPARLALAEAGCVVIVNGRDARDSARRRRSEIRAATGAEVVVGRRRPRRRRRSREALLAACPEPDILVNNNGGPPPSAVRRADAREHLARARGQHADADRAACSAVAAGHGGSGASAASSTSPRPRCARRSPASTSPRARAPA